LTVLMVFAELTLVFPKGNQEKRTIIALTTTVLSLGVYYF
jgi:hypothetical protein